MSGRFWIESGRCLECAFKVSGKGMEKGLEGVWKGSGRGLECVWKVFGKKSGNVLDRAQEGVLKRFGSDWNG